LFEGGGGGGGGGGVVGGEVKVSGRHGMLRKELIGEGFVVGVGRRKGPGKGNT